MTSHEQYTMSQDITFVYFIKILNLPISKHCNSLYVNMITDKVLFNLLLIFPSYSFLQRLSMVTALCHTCGLYPKMKSYSVRKVFNIFFFAKTWWISMKNACMRRP